MKKSAAILMILTGITTIVAFARELILAYFYGASYITDAYLISLIIPQTLVAFLGAAIGSIYIPMYRNIEYKISIRRADEFTSNILNFLFLICTLIVLLVYTFTPYFIKIFAIGFTGQTFELAIKFTRISIIAIYFSIILNLIGNYLQVKNKFGAFGIISLPLNIIIIISILLSVKYNLYILSIGSVVGAILQLLLILPSIKKAGFQYSFNLNKKDIYIKKFISLSIPVILGVSVYQINTIVGQAIASQVVEGGISALSYASRVNALVFGLFAVPVATVMYPMISKMSAENKIKELKEIVSKAFISVMLLVLPATLGSMVLAEPIVRLLFGRGVFDNQDIHMTASALFFYSLGMIGVSLREILYRTYYSFQDTRTPLINAVIAMVLNIILSIILSKQMGIAGIALANSVTSILCAILLFVNLRKKLGNFFLKDLFKTPFKIIVTSIMMGYFTMIVYKILINFLNFNIVVILSIILGGIFYVLLINLMKIKEFDEVVLLIKKKLKLK